MLGVVGFFKHFRNAAHDGLEWRSHEVDGAVGVDDGILEEVAAVRWALLYSSEGVGVTHVVVVCERG